MPSAIILTALRDRVEEALVDNTNLIWATATLDEAIRQALHEYSAARPNLAMVDLALTAVLSTNGREVSVSGITDMIRVVEVWAPYAAADDRAKNRKFEFWPDLNKIHLVDGEKLLSTATARIFYQRLHTLNGLDSATATTIRLGDDSLVVLGAVGYAALARAIDLVEQVRVDPAAVEQLREVSTAALGLFRARLGTALTPGPHPQPLSQGARGE